jgi:hypothetical protein
MSFTRHRASLHLLRAACVGLFVWIPWMAHLAEGRGSLPSTLGWVLLDLAELAALVTTARLLYHHDERTASAAIVSATLLTSDAVIDVLTSAQGSQQVLALAMAAMVEIPLALLCCSIAAMVQARWQAGEFGQPSRVRSSATGLGSNGSYAAPQLTAPLRQLARPGVR